MAKLGIRSHYRHEKVDRVRSAVGNNVSREGTEKERGESRPVQRKLFFFIWTLHIALYKFKTKTMQI